VGLWSRAVPVLSRLTLAGTAAYVGWKVGSGVRALWVEAPVPTTVEAPDFDHATLYPKGEVVYAFWGQDFPMPYSGWLLDAGGNTGFWVRDANDPCPRYLNMPEVPAGGDIFIVDGPSQSCWIQPWGPETYVIPQQGIAMIPLRTSAPVLFDNQPYDATVSAGSDPGLAGATADVGVELDDHPEEYPNLGPWLQTALDDIDFARAEADWQTNDSVDDVVDPDREEYPWAAPPDTDWQRWCELSTPGAGMAAINPQPDPFTSYDTPPTFPASTIGTADLLYGTDSENGYGKWNDIKGFGVRKIAAKHGWTTADITATAGTLLNTPTRGPYGNGARYEFRGSSYPPPNPAAVASGYLSQGHCERVVIVATQADTIGGQTEPRSRGIVTSFGKWIGPHPLP